MADKTILDFPELLDNQDSDVIYALRGTGTGRDRHQSRLNFLQDILLFGVPEHSLTRSYAENTGMCQNEGMVWASKFVGANVGNLPSTNQDKWNPVMAPTKPETISATGAFTTLFKYHHITSDTSGGANTITLSNGKFDGQKVTVICDGIGLTYVKGTGVYDGASSLGTPISDGLKGTWTWNANLAKWIPDNEITANYVSGSQDILQLSNGNMDISRVEATSGANSISIIYALSFASVSETQKNLFTDINNIFASGLAAISTLTGIGYRFFKADTGGFQVLTVGSNLSWGTKGKY